MRTGALTVIRLPEVPNRLHDHDHCPSTEQGGEDPKGMLAYAQSADCHSSTTCSSHWLNDSMLTCHCSSSSSLPWSSESSILGLASLHDFPVHVSRSKSRSQLMDQLPHLSDVSSHSTTNGIPNAIDGCLDHRLGSLLS